MTKCSFFVAAKKNTVDMENESVGTSTSTLNLSNGESFYQPKLAFEHVSHVQGSLQNGVRVDISLCTDSEKSCKTHQESHQISAVEKRKKIFPQNKFIFSPLTSPAHGTNRKTFFIPAEENNIEERGSNDRYGEVPSTSIRSLSFIEWNDSIPTNAISKNSMDEFLSKEVCDKRIESRSKIQRNVPNVSANGEILNFNSFAKYIQRSNQISGQMHLGSERAMSVLSVHIGILYVFMLIMIGCQYIPRDA